METTTIAGHQVRIRPNYASAVAPYCYEVMDGKNVVRVFWSYPGELDVIDAIRAHRNGVTTPTAAAVEIKDLRPFNEKESSRRGQIKAGIATKRRHERWRADRMAEEIEVDE